MGREKALVEFRGTPLWEHQLSTLRATLPNELLISTASPEIFDGSGLQIVHDEAPGMGPLAGISAALRVAKHEMLLVLAIDLPEMQANFLARLVADSVGIGLGIVPLGDNWFEPLAAVYPRTCLALAKEHLRASDRSMQRFIRAGIKAKLVAPFQIDAGLQPYFRNVNEASDLPRIR